jgi:hypothetical protein
MTYLDAMEGMIAMGLYHTAAATQQAPHRAIFALVFGFELPAGDTDILANGVTMAIMTK